MILIVPAMLKIVVMAKLLASAVSSFPPSPWDSLSSDENDPTDPDKRSGGALVQQSQLRAQGQTFLDRATQADASPSSNRRKLRGTILLDFEGVPNMSFIGDYYNGGDGPNYGVEFRDNAHAWVDSDAISGGSDLIANEPSPSTVLSCSEPLTVVNVPAGFKTGLSFYFGSPNPGNAFAVFDGLDASGNQLGWVEMPLFLPGTRGGDPTGVQYDDWRPVNITFDGVARSISLNNGFDFFVLDDLTIGSPKPGNRNPVANCQAARFPATANCQASPSVDDLIAAVNNGSTDPNGDSMIFSFSPSGPFDIGLTVITMTVEDGFGGEDSCEAAITVYDNEAPLVDCGTRGVIAPCQVPVTLQFGAAPKVNGCPSASDINVSYDGCYFCKKTKAEAKTMQRNCVVDTSAGDGTVIITDTGGVESHLIFDVTIIGTSDSANGVEPLRATETCTICTQQQSKDVNPGCSSGTAASGNNTKYQCASGFPTTSFECSI